MKHKLNIPSKINVGFQNREDTYTGKLAFVVYTDDKGVLRKERSWNGWRDNKIGPEEFENIPTDGFVLNKKVGDGRYGWNPRKAWIRVYDPRGFEFEISVNNLVFILEECSSIKGKGLEGEFIYAWDRAELLLLPVGSQEYKDSVEFKNACKDKVKKADIKEGFCFLTKDNEEVMYLGKLPHWSWHSKNNNQIFKSQNQHIFVLLNEIYEDKYIVEKNFSRILARTSDEPSAAFADLYEKYIKSEFGSGPTKLAAKKCSKSSRNYWYDRTFVEQDGMYHTVVEKSYGWGKNYESQLEMAKDPVIVESGKLVTVPSIYSSGKTTLPKPANQYNVVSLFVVNEHKKRIKIG